MTFPALVNRIEPDNPDEPHDCALRSLQVYLGVPVTDVIRIAARVIDHGGKHGLPVDVIKRIAAMFGAPLVEQREFDPDESYGIVLVAWRKRRTLHAAILRNGLVFDRQTVWPWDAWHADQARSVRTKTGAIVPMTARLLVARE